MTAGLFEEPFDVEVIDPLISGISIQSWRFLQCAVVTCGMPDRWEAALDQVARLVTLWESLGEDDTHLYRLLAMLGLRAAQLRDRDERRASFSRKYPHLEIGRINFVAMEIIRTKPRWYPLELPLTPEQVDHARKFWGSV